MQYDVVIVGAGMVGLSIAAYLAQHSSARIAVCDPALAQKTDLPAGAQVVDFDLRVSALSAQSQSWLQNLGAWQHIERKQAYQRMHVWDAEGTAAVTFDCHDLHRSDLGHIVENRQTVAALLQLVQSLPVTVFSQAVAHIDNPVNDLTPVVLQDGSRLQASLVIGADGALSRVRQWAGLATREWDYQHHAIVATVRMEQSLQHTAWQRFRSQGPLALLPLAQDPHLASIVWSTVPQQAEWLMTLSDGDFASALAEAFEYKLGGVCEVSERVAIPLRQRHAKHYVSHGIALAGDAAHTIHPLAGQGVNLGFKDAMALSEEVARALGKGLAAGRLDVLQRYERRRQADNLATMVAMEGFKRVFAADNHWLRLLRNQGMRWFDGCLPVKQHLMLQALGL